MVEEVKIVTDLIQFFKQLHLLAVEQVGDMKQQEVQVVQVVEEVEMDPVEELVTPLQQFLHKVIMEEVQQT